MCFDIDVKQMSLNDLYQTRTRISTLLSQPAVVERLPDHGHQLKQVLEKLKEEIKYRENLNATHNKLEELRIKSASESSLSGAHGIRLCSLEKRPEQERFKPNLSLRSTPSGRSESMKELRTGVKPLDLAISLRLMKEQDERIKSGLMRAKQNRLMAELSLLKNDHSSTEPESEPASFAAVLEEVPEENEELYVVLPEEHNEDVPANPSNVMGELPLDLGDDSSEEEGLSAKVKENQEASIENEILLIGETSDVLIVKQLIVTSFQGSEGPSTDLTYDRQVLAAASGGMFEQAGEIPSEAAIATTSTAMEIQDSDDSETEVDQEALDAQLDEGSEASGKRMKK